MNSSNKELLEYETFFKNSTVTHMGTEQVQISECLTSDEEKSYLVSSHTHH